MLGQIGGFRKPLVTPCKFALERFLPGVNTSMNGQGSRDGKLASAPWLWTFKRLLARVDSHVLSHDIGFGESLLADLTLVGFVPSMGLNVSHSLLPLCKPTFVPVAALP